MDCRVCPKRNRCSGSSCYYDYYPELYVDEDDYELREALEDAALLAATEAR